MIRLPLGHTHNEIDYWNATEGIPARIITTYRYRFAYASGDYWHLEWVDRRGYVVRLDLSVLPSQTVYGKEKDND